MKIIKREIQKKEAEDIKRLNFIPNIDDCSREIANIKREVSRGPHSSIYED